MDAAELRRIVEGRMQRHAESLAGQRYAGRTGSDWALILRSRLYECRDILAAMDAMEAMEAKPLPPEPGAA